jgi:hypothetical protein
VDNVAAEQLADHRVVYLDYEGPVGGDRGRVTRLDSGTFTSIKESPDEWIVTLSGQTIRGRLILRRTPPTSSSWELAFHDSAATNRQ